MHLSLHADYSLRVLLYLGAHPGRVAPTKAISDAYGISRNHLVRVVQTLHQHGYVNITLGRGGGVSLAMQPEEIRLGEVVRRAEPSLRLVECFDNETNTCPIVGACRLKAHLRRAMEAFLAELDRTTLADLLAGGNDERLALVFLERISGG